MKIDEVLKDLEPKGREEMVYEYIKSRPDEVFAYYDDDLKNAFPKIPQESLNWYLYSLAKKGKITKTDRIGRYVYFGTQTAVNDLINRLPQDLKTKK